MHAKKFHNPDQAFGKAISEIQAAIEKDDIEYATEGIIGAKEDIYQFLPGNKTMSATIATKATDVLLCDSRG